MQNEVFVIPMPTTASAASLNLPLSGDSKLAPTPSAHANRDFVVGPENRLAANAVQWLIARHGECYSPVVVQGTAGSGKSHLAEAVANSHANVVCTSGAEFARELATALEDRTIEQFRQRYRSAGMLVFEDLNQLSGRRVALEELKCTLDELERREAAVFVTTRVPPKEIAGLSAEMQSRLTAGLLLTLSPPGLEARLQILERMAAGRGLTLAPEAAQLLAEKLSVAAPALNGALLELELAAGVKSIVQADVERYLAARMQAAQPTVKQITATVAKQFGLKPAALAQASRRRQVALARSIAIYLCRRLTGQSLQALGKQFGGRDHTTVLHSIRTVEERITSDIELRNTVNAIEQELVGQESVKSIS